MAKDKNNSLSALGKLVAGSNRPGEPDDDGNRDEKLEEDIGKVMALVAELAGEDIFDMQFLIEACSEEVREQIRADAQGEEDEDE